MNWKKTLRGKLRIQTVVSRETAAKFAHWAITGVN